MNTQHWLLTAVTPFHCRMMRLMWRRASPAKSLPRPCFLCTGASKQVATQHWRFLACIGGLMFVSYKALARSEPRQTKDCSFDFGGGPSWQGAAASSMPSLIQAGPRQSFMQRSLRVSEAFYVSIRICKEPEVGPCLIVDPAVYLPFSQSALGPWTSGSGFALRMQLPRRS